MFDTGALHNPHLKNIGRSPYELGNLLRLLPSDFSAHSAATPEHILIADAALYHAGNSNSTLMRGLEGLGHLMYVAGDNKDHEIDSTAIANLGELLQHLAVEAQFMQETRNNLAGALQTQRRRVNVSTQEASHV
ncbi:hypothetical protein AAKU55_000539 [Oxalobacteraceae bacterium GrIS 1.11]